MKKINLNIKMILTMIGLLAFVGCQPPAKSGVRSYSASQRSDIVNTTGGSGIFQNTCSSGQSAIGAIYDPTGFSNNSTISFEERVKLFLSATTLPSDVGTISNGPTDSIGVRFQGTIKLDQNGNVVTSQSKISIKVYDSLSAQDTSVQPIPVTINTANSGQFNMQTGIGYIVFKDQYGEIRLDGKIDSQYFSGAISYTNYKTVIENGSNSSGYLGQFYINRCGMIQ